MHRLLKKYGARPNQYQIKWISFLHKHFFPYDENTTDNIIRWALDYGQTLQRIKDKETSLANANSPAEIRKLKNEIQSLNKLFDDETARMPPPEVDMTPEDDRPFDSVS